MENVIRNRRKELGLSQEELAKKCGVSRQTVNAIENNKYDPTLALAFSLAKELQLTVDELFIPTCPELLQLNTRRPHSGTPSRKSEKGLLLFFCPK